MEIRCERGCQRYPLLCCRVQRGDEYVFVYHTLMDLGQDIYIIKVSRSGVEHTSPQNRLNLFCKDGFNVLCPDFNPFFFETGTKTIAYCFGGDNISGSNIDL